MIIGLYKRTHNVWVVYHKINGRKYFFSCYEKEEDAKVLAEKWGKEYGYKFVQ